MPRCVLMRAVLVMLLSTGTATAAPGKCTHADALALAKIHAARWKLPAMTETEEIKTDEFVRLDGPNTSWLDFACVAGAFGKPAFFIDALENHFEGTKRVMTRYRLVVTRDGSVVASTPVSRDFGRVEDHSYKFRVLDVDGDGVDEILVEHSFEHHALAHSESIDVVGIRKTKLLSLGTMLIESGGSNRPTCEGKAVQEKVGKATRLVVEVPDSKPECAKAGRHYYGLVGDKLVEITRDGKLISNAKP